MDDSRKYCLPALTVVCLYIIIHQLETEEGDLRSGSERKKLMRCQWIDIRIIQSRCGSLLRASEETLQASDVPEEPTIRRPGGGYVTTKDKIVAPVARSLLDHLLVDHSATGDSILPEDESLRGRNCWNTSPLLRALLSTVSLCSGPESPAVSLSILESR